MPNLAQTTNVSNIHHDVLPPSDSDSRSQMHRGASYACIAFFVAAGSVMLIWLLRAYPPTTYGWMPQCVFYQTTGLHCPGCGGTRAVTALFNGDLWLAIRCNPFLIIGLPLILSFVGWQRRRRLAGQSNFRWTAWFLFVVVTAFFVVRNVPTPTRSPLAPPGEHQR